MILDLGCGKKVRKGCIRVDFNKRHKPDIIHDLNKFPYPFDKHSVDYIYLDNTLEHLDNVIRVMEEIYRILKPNGEVKIIVPYFRSIWAYADSTHKHFFTTRSFDYYDPKSIINQRYDYTLAKFNIEKICFNETLTNNFLKKIVVNISNKWPWIYEYYFSHLYPLDDITFYLKKIS